VLYFIKTDFISNFPLVISLYLKLKPTIAIIGAGLTGLLIAYRLKQMGFTIQILEARDRLGGRISTVLTANETPVEMGATWFGNQHINLIKLLDELDISYFEQYMKGTAFFEAFSTAPPQAIQIPQDSPSYRIESGTSKLIITLAKKLNQDEIKLAQPVTELIFENKTARLKIKDDTFDVDIVISTVPPALLVSSIQFTPSLPTEFIRIATNTHTWMQDSIKVALVYQTPFWKNKKLSGTIFSNVGPITEFYDQSDSTETRFALCGFVNGGYVQLTKSERKEKVMNQLFKIVGKEALDYLSYDEVIWSREIYTKDKKQDSVSVYPHQNNGNPIFSNAYYDNRFFIAGSETSTIYPGYMEGAIISANRIIEKIENLVR
jgi:monoamine oxidase